LDQLFLFAFRDAAEETHRIVQLGVGDQRFQLYPQVAVADDPQLGAGDLLTDARPHAHHFVVAFVALTRVEPSDHDRAGRVDWLRNR
jgi:hypothetical protein